MTVEELAKILNKMIADGKGDCKVATMDFDIRSYYVCKDALLLLEYEGSK